MTRDPQAPRFSLSGGERRGALLASRDDHAPARAHRSSLSSSGGEGRGEEAPPKGASQIGGHSPLAQTMPGPGKQRQLEAVVLGASAGAVEALSVILPRLPPNYPLPLMLVVHVPPDRESALPQLFQAKCRLHVKEAEDKEPIVPGTIYFAPPNYHVLVEPERRLSLSTDEPVLFCRPSIDVLFESAAEVYGPALLGVILTGANSDGARGLAAICQAGGRGLVQSPPQAQVPAMPQAALQACPQARVLGLEDIAAFLLDFTLREPNR